MLEVSPLSPAVFEDILEGYLNAVGAIPDRVPGQPRIYRISPSAMFASVLPAYLEVNRERPSQALKELVEMDPKENGEMGEAWRVVAYLSLRLLQGAEPDVSLLHEMRGVFSKSAIATHLQTLEYLIETPNSNKRNRVVGRWADSQDARARALLGIYSFFRSPSDWKEGLKRTYNSTDQHRLSERVMGLLTGIYLSRDGKQNLALPERKVLISPLIPGQADQDAVSYMKDKREAQQEELLAGMEKIDQPELWRQVLVERLSPTLSDPALRKELEASLGQLHAELLKTCWFLSSRFSPEVILQVLHDMKLLHLPARAAWEAPLPAPVTEQDRSWLIDRIREDYQNLFKKPLEIAESALKGKAAALPEASVAILNSGAQNEASRLLMAKALGIPGLPPANEILTAYYKWFLTNSDR